MNEFIEYMLSEQSFLDTANAIHEKEDEDDLWRERYMNGDNQNYYYNCQHYTDWKEGYRSCGCCLQCDGQHEEKRDRAWRRVQRKKKIVSRSKVIENWGCLLTPQISAWVENTMKDRGFNFKFNDYPRVMDIQNIRKSMGLTKKQFSQTLHAISESVRDENYKRNVERYNSGEIKLINRRRVVKEIPYQFLSVDEDGNYFYKTRIHKRVEWVEEVEKDVTKIMKRLKKMSRNYGVSQWFLRQARGVVTGRLAKHQYRMSTGWKHNGTERKRKLLWDILRKEIEEEVQDFDWNLIESGKIEKVEKSS